MSACSSPEARTRSTERRAAASATWKSPWMSTTSHVGVRLRMRELATRTRVHVWKTFAWKGASVERIEQANSFQGTGSCSQTRKRRERLPATPTALFNASEKNHGRERQRNGRSRKQSQALAFVPLRLDRVVPATSARKPQVRIVYANVLVVRGESPRVRTQGRRRGRESAAYCSAGQFRHDALD